MFTVRNKIKYKRTYPDDGYSNMLFLFGKFPLKPRNIELNSGFQRPQRKKQIQVNEQLQEINEKLTDNVCTSLRQLVGSSGENYFKIINLGLRIINKLASNADAIISVSKRELNSLFIY